MAGKRSAGRAIDQNEFVNRGSSVSLKSEHEPPEQVLPIMAKVLCIGKDKFLDSAILNAL